MAGYEKQLRQFYSVKSKVTEEIDSHDPDDRHYIKRKADLDDRLYRMYDKTEDVETVCQLMRRSVDNRIERNVGKRKINYREEKKDIRRTDYVRKQRKTLL